MSRPIAEIRGGDQEPYSSTLKEDAIRGLINDLFSYSGEYGEMIDIGVSERAKDQLTGLVDKMVELGILDLQELIASSPEEPQSLLNYLGNLLMAPNIELILANKSLIHGRINQALFAKDGETEELKELTGGELDEVDFETEEMRNKTIVAELTNELHGIARAMPSKEYLSRLARASKVNRGRSTTAY